VRKAKSRSGQWRASDVGHAASPRPAVEKDESAREVAAFRQRLPTEEGTVSRAIHVMTSVVAAAAIFPASGWAQSAWVSPKGTAGLGVNYQLVLTDGNYGNLTEEHTLSFEGLEAYTVHNVMLSGEYSITDRLSLSASVPWLNVKFTGDPTFLPHGHDDGTHETYSYLEDLTLYSRYMFRPTDQLTVTPLLGFNYPLTDYTDEGHGIAGLGLYDIRAGVALGGVFSRFVTQVVLYHQFMEPIEPYERFEIDRTNASAMAGYFITDDLSAHLGGFYKHTWDGTSFKELGPVVMKVVNMEELTPLEQAIFDSHDPAVQERGFIARAGASYRLIDYLAIDASYMRTLFGESMQAAQAFNVGVTVIYDPTPSPGAGQQGEGGD
jgi:hypothetical protein